MKKILIYLVTLVDIFMCSSCKDSGYPIEGNTLVVTNEYAVDENISLYTLKYDDTRASGLGVPVSRIRMKYDRKAFEVGDTVKIVKVTK